jgi:hypothetical protein
LPPLADVSTVVEKDPLPKFLPGLSTSPQHLHLQNTTLCLLYPHISEEVKDVTTSWQVAVLPITTLECIRQNLGPCCNDIVNYLLAHGMEFYTLQTMNALPPLTPGWQPLLWYRPTGYVSD